MTKKTDKQEQAALVEQPENENMGALDIASENSSDSTDTTSQVPSPSVEKSTKGDAENVITEDANPYYSVVIPFFKAKHREEEVLKVILNTCMKIFAL